MKNRILSIDLGSAYTKVSFRNGTDAQSRLITDLPLASKDLPFCVPSVVACVRRSTEETWLTGGAAASQLPGPHVTIYRNWKAALFPDMNAPNADMPAQGARALSQSEAILVAHKFFQGLRSALSAAVFESDLSSFPVRVCIPDLGDFEVAEQLIKRILEETGWDPAAPDPAKSEPLANAVGIMSLGANATWVPGVVDNQPYITRAVALPRMLTAHGLLEALNRVNGEYSILTVDIGAFTTDFGYVTFDAGRGSELNRPQILQRSSRLGVHDLDRSVYDRLAEPSKRAVRAATSADWDRVKALLYSNRSGALRDPQGGTIDLGKQKEEINEALADFAKGVWALARKFCSDHGISKVDAWALTGGGSMIPFIGATISNHVSEEWGSGSRNLLADALNQGAIDRAGVVEGARNAVNDMNEIIRGGTAIGGASVFFETERY